MQTALKDSLNALDDMLQDFFVEHSNDPELTDQLKEIVETAQRNINTARMLRGRNAMNNSKPEQTLGLGEINKKLNMPERWAMRHISKRKSVQMATIGSNAARLIDFGLVSEAEGTLRLTGLGVALSELWSTTRKAA